MREFGVEQPKSEETEPIVGYAFYHRDGPGEDSKQIGEIIEADSREEAIEKFEKREKRKFGEIGDSLNEP